MLNKIDFFMTDDLNDLRRIIEKYRTKNIQEK